MRDLQSISIRRSHAEIEADPTGETLWTWTARYASPPGIEIGQLRAPREADKEALVAALPPRLREAAMMIGFLVRVTPAAQGRLGVSLAQATPPSCRSTCTGRCERRCRGAASPAKAVAKSLAVSQ